MLTKDDLHKIGELMDERTETVLMTVKEGFDGVDERFDRLENRMGSMENRMDSMEGRMDSIEGKMVTKEDLDRKLGNFEVRLTERFDNRYLRK